MTHENSEVVYYYRVLVLSTSMFLFIARIDGLVFPAAFSSGQTIFDRRGNLQLATAVDYFKQHGKELRVRGTCSFPLILFTRWEKRTTGCSKSYFSDIIGGQKRKSKKFLSRIVASTFSAFSANFHRRKTLLGFVSKNKIFPI